MAGTVITSIFEEIGVKPVINAVGNQTVLGGSQLSPRVRAAMEEANRYFIDMAELLERSGKIIAAHFAVRDGTIRSPPRRRHL